MIYLFFYKDGNRLSLINLFNSKLTSSPDLNQNKVEKPKKSVPSK
jgi:hypothetical protein